MKRPLAGSGAEDAGRAYRQLASNVVFLFGAYALPRVLTVGAVVLAARVLGAEAFGQYGTAAAFAVILSVVATVGMSPLLIREIARTPSRAPALLRAAHLVKTGTNLVMLALVYVGSRFVLGYSPDVADAALVLGFAYAVGAYVENYSAYFQGVERMHVWTQASGTYGIVTGLTGAAAVMVTGSVTAFCAAAVAGQLASLAWLRFRAPRDHTIAVAWADVRALLGALRPFAASFVILTVYYKVDVLLLERVQPTHVVGVYTAAYKVIDIVQALTLVGIGAMYPRLSRLAGGDAVGHPASRLFEAGWLIMVPLAGTLAFLREPAVLAAFGPGYETAAGPVQWLAVSMPILTFSLVASYVLSAERRVWPVAGAYTAALATNVTLNLWLAPALGATGTALAKLGSEVVLGTAFWLALRPVLRPVLPRRVAAAVGLLAATGVLVGTATMPVGWQVAAWFGATLVAYTALGVGPRYWMRMVASFGTAMSSAQPESSGTAP